MPHICSKMTENPKQFRRFTDRKITIFTLGLQNANINISVMWTMGHLVPRPSVSLPLYGQYYSDVF